MSKEKFKEEHMMKLQGKEYLPVAPRVVMFRAEHPEWSIITTTAEIAGETYVRAEVAYMDPNGRGVIAATAHKRVRKDAKGPAALWPLETAETGAIGRALALCGYGTLAGDLDEGEQIADAPVEVGPKPTQIAKSVSSKSAAPAKNPTATDWVTKLDAVKNKKDFDAAYGDALEYLETLARNSDEYVAVSQAGVRARNRVAK
jgi:hypothetical protein